MKRKTKKSEFRMVQPNGSSGLLLEVVEPVTCGLCLRKVYVTGFVTRKYNKETSTMGYACKNCVPFRFIDNFYQTYNAASDYPVEYKRN